MTCSSAFWKRKRKNLKKVGLTFSSSGNSNPVQMWSETLMDGLITLHKGTDITRNRYRSGAYLSQSKLIVQ